MNQAKILKQFMKSREIYEKFAPYILALKNTDKDFKLTAQVIHAYYNKYNKIDFIEPDELDIFIEQSQLMLPGSTKEFIKSLKEVSIVNEDLTMDMIEHAVEQHIASKMLDKIALVIDNNKAGIIHTLQDDIDEYINILRNPPKLSIKALDFNFDAMMDEEVLKKGFSFISDTMNETIKGAKPGTNGLIFAFVDTGKTSFGVANMVSMAQQINKKTPNETRPIVYAGNEEGIQRVALRATQCIMNMNDQELILNKRKVKSELKVNGFQRLRFIDYTTHMRNVEQILDKYHPLVLFIDQGTKVKPVGVASHDVNSLQETFNLYRELAKQHDTCIVSLAQADSDSDDKKYLSLRNVYGSKSAIQGELDWAIGIGVI